jgi:hypothetical protein
MHRLSARIRLAKNHSCQSIAIHVTTHMTSQIDWSERRLGSLNSPIIASWRITDSQVLLICLLMILFYPFSRISRLKRYLLDYKFVPYSADHRVDSPEMMTTESEARIRARIHASWRPGYPDSRITRFTPPPYSHPKRAFILNCLVVFDILFRYFWVCFN